MDGLGHLTRALESIKESVRNRYLRKAVEKASRIVRKAARQNIKTGRGSWVPTDLLKRSIEVRVRTYSQGKVVGVVGPDKFTEATIGYRKTSRSFIRKVFERVRSTDAGSRGQFRGYRDTGRTQQITLEAGRAFIHRPALIAHLVEFGHGGPKPAPAYPFMRPAWESSREACMEAIRDTLEAALAKELRS